MLDPTLSSSETLQRFYQPVAISLNQRLINWWLSSVLSLQQLTLSSISPHTNLHWIDGALCVLIFDDHFTFRDLFTFISICMLKKNNMEKKTPPILLILFGAFAACKGVKHFNRKSLVRSGSKRLNIKQSDTQKKPFGYWIYPLTCTEPENVPEQNCVDLEAAAACWMRWKWKDVPVKWIPAIMGEKNIYWIIRKIIWNQNNYRKRRESKLQQQQQEKPDTQISVWSHRG